MNRSPLTVLTYVLAILAPFLFLLFLALGGWDAQMDTSDNFNMIKGLMRGYRGR
jgi:hypothetical protein